MSLAPKRSWFAIASATSARALSLRSPSKTAISAIGKESASLINSPHRPEVQNKRSGIGVSGTSDLVKIAVPAKAVPKAARPRHTVLRERFAPIVPFLNERFAHVEAMALDGRAPIGAHANLRKARDLP